MVGSGELPLKENTIALETLYSLEDHLSSAASLIMTGMRKRSEQQQFTDASSALRRCYKALLLDSAYRNYDTYADSDTIKKDIFSDLQTSEYRIKVLDYEKRLESSRFERSKQWLAYHKKTRFLGLTALYGTAVASTTLVATQFVQDSEASLLQINSVLSRGGIAGATAIMTAVALSQLRRNVPRQLGGVLKNQVHTSLESYLLERTEDENGKRIAFKSNDLIEKYAERDLAVTLGAVGVKLIGYDLKSKTDIEPMIDDVLDTLEIATLENYGICLEEPWYKQWAGQYAEI